MSVFYTVSAKNNLLFLNIIDVLRLNFAANKQC